MTASLAIELRARRRALGLSQAAVADRVSRALRSGTSDRIVSAWESGRTSPRQDSLEAWASALGYTLTLTPVDAS